MASDDREQRVIYVADGYEPAIARWVWALEDTRQRTKECLAKIQDSVIDWIPPEGGNSIGALLYHLAAIELSYVYEDILEVGWAAELEPLLTYDVRDNQGTLIAVRGETLVEHLGRLDAARALLLNAFRQMTVDDFRRPRRLEDYDITPEWILHHLMQHEAEHRGQISEIAFRAMAMMRS